MTDSSEPDGSVDELGDPDRLRWYGGKVFLADMGAVGLAITGFAILWFEVSELAGLISWMLAVGVYLVGGPVIHGMLGEVSKAVRSLAMRVVAPAAAGGSIYLGLMVLWPDDPGPPSVGVAGIFLYLGVGMVVAGIAVAMGVDWWQWSWKKIAGESETEEST